jgi:23S rRNA pseudouridine2604 synthase
MATLKLNKKPAAPAARKPDGEKRAPLRGKGVSRPRQTLEQAQAERQEKQARYEQRRREEEAAQQRPPARPASRNAAPARPKPPARATFQREAPREDRRDGPWEERREPRREVRRDEPQFAPARPPRQDQRRATGPRDEYAPRAPRAPREPSPNAAEGERLSKVMSERQLASRREADEWIGAGWVRVDGKVAELGQRVGPDVQIEIDPRARQEQNKQVTILLHKPIGYVSGQAEDGYEPASVLIKSDKHWKDDASGIKFNIGHARGLAPAGRLDIDSTGLLVLTQDGRIAKVLIGEDSDIEKEYLVRVEFDGQGAPMERFPAEQLELLNHGLELDGVQLKPARVSWQNEDQLRFVLREGRKRQIRRMCELVGLKVVGLKRVRIGRIPLGKLPVGEWRFLSPWEKF